jgi:hypothetical protein
MSTQPDISEEERRHEAVDVTVRSPAGHSHEFRFRLDEFGAEAAATAIAYFVERKEIEPGDYVLELLRDGVKTPISDTARLRDYDLHNGDELHLITAKPQVDG